jgi:hypothetical protein
MQVMAMARPQVAPRQAVLASAVVLAVISVASSAR